MIRVAAVGDIFPGGILSDIDSGFVSKEIMKELNNADIRVGTLETAIGNEPTFYEEKMTRLADVIYTKDHDLVKLKHLSIDIVSLANNHFFDLGLSGARHAIQLLDELGIKHIGAGNNIKEASAPVVETIAGKTIAFLAFCDWRNETVGWCPTATETEPGINPMNDDYVISEIKKYKCQNDYVVVMPHWGKEHTRITTQHVYKLAQRMIRAGADLILGSHPHRVHPVVNYKHASVAYSMGNFLFPDRLIIKPRSTYYPDVPIDLSGLPVTYEYPYVEQLTYKKWRALARVGMIVQASFEKEQTRSIFCLTRADEKGRIWLYDSKEIESILKRRGRLLNNHVYPLLYYLERLYFAIIRRIGIRHN